MLWALGEAGQVVARWEPSRNGVDQPEALEDVAVRTNGHLGGRLAVSLGRGASNLVEGRRRTRRSGVRRHPAPERFGLPYRVTLFEEVAVHNARQVAIELRAERSTAQAAQAGETGANDLRRVAGEIDSGTSRDRWLRTGEKFA